MGEGVLLAPAWLPTQFCKVLWHSSKDVKADCRVFPEEDRVRADSRCAASKKREREEERERGREGERDLIKRETGLL